MQANYDTRSLAGWTAAIVTVAAFGKTFMPFYLIGSTAIFFAASAVGVVLVAMSWRPICNNARHIVDILVVLALFYGIVIVSFLLHSRPAIPVTHLLGILIFHGIFLLFGFVAAHALKTVLMVILGAAATYSIMLIQHTVRFGDVMREYNLNDIFGVGNPVIFTALHQNIGIVLGLGALATLGLASNRLKQVLAVGVLPIVLLLFFHIAARAALVALTSSLIFLGFAACWVRSKKFATLGATAVIVAVAITSGVFYQRALQDDNVDALSPDAISRTIRELHNPDPGFRMQIWTNTLHHIVSEPDRLLFGRGIGMYPVNEGFGAPDWLLHKTEGARHYPHNVHLEMLYETGIAGLLVFSILTLFPLVTSLRRWQLFSGVEKSTVSIYVFILVSSEISGAFAFSYMDQFFFALVVGTIALKRRDNIAVPSLPSPKEVPIKDIPCRFVSDPVDE